MDLNLSDLVARKASTTDESGVPGELLVLDLDNGRYYTLGETSGFIWSRLDGVSSLEEIAIEVVESFEVELETAEADLLGFAERMVELELAVRDPI